jgi:DNA-binding transcriptional MocR family regulator
MAEFLKSGDYKRHLAYKRNLLEIQRDQLASALLKHLGSKIMFFTPKGGLSIWIELDENVDSLKLYNRAIFKGIVLAPGVLFSVEPHFKNYMRLSFSHPTVGKRENALIKLKKLIHDSV